MKIREAKFQDAKAIADFQVAMAMETENMTLDDETISKGVEAVFNDTSKGKYILVEHNNETVASMLLTPEWSDWRNGYFLWIQSVYVQPDFRKKGVFRKMYEFSKEMILSQPEYIGLRLYVVKTNLPALEVYRVVGMKETDYRMFEWVKE
jgi:GNAT superfamily N-acetyltransferase